MRGQKLYNEIITRNDICKAQRKGRSNSLVGKRNDCLIARYYYYGTIKHRGYEEMLQELLREFFLSPATIANIINESMEQMQLLKQMDPGLAYFYNKWPHLRW